MTFPNPDGYTGPPHSAPPPRGWKVPEVIVPAAPRELPSQDHEAIEDAETQARTFSHGLAILAASLMIVVLIVYIVRALT
ncbi:MAG TPA: hypothetical protein VE172_15895 [Stackebrandtia sp.]|jgi:hypothetical protein|uniref:hypothetical protein n=1 Tax=Stackebrandtia sp. TaxID=2023065 RepID=UPI002D4310CE|nr:hypothetical protein [Stackebrandtia sp.]HZE40287.1 hypothetical protein [Stackebrandtia sp.]